MLEFYPNHHHHHPHFHQQHPFIKDEGANSILQDKMASPGSEAVDKVDVAVKCEKNYEICEGCGQKIYDRYLMRVANSSYHEQCLNCSVCNTNLHHSCYARNTKLYCKTDYDRIFSIKCSRCSERVMPQDMVMRVQHHVYHLPCFNCSVCFRLLEKGQQYFMNAGQLFCHLHYDPSAFYSAPSSYGGGGPGSVIDDLDDDLLDDGLCSIRSRDGRRGPKRPRTILTSVQRRQFKASFEVSPKPCRKVREALAKDTGLSVRVVQVWFQNQRAKMKKIQRKAKHSDGDKQGDKEGKDEKRIKQENSEGYGGLDSSFGSSSGGQPVNPNPFSPDDFPAHSNDSFCSSEMSLDGSSSFGQIDEATTDTFHAINSGGGGGSVNPNPIDKLYLMQNSYFSRE